MPVYLLSDKVLIDGGSVAISEDCCCDCNSCDDLPPSNPLGPPTHINIVRTLSGTCDSGIVYTGSITYDQDLSFGGPVGPIGGHFFCISNVTKNNGDAFWSGNFTKTCGAAHSDFGSAGSGGFLGRDTADCSWWFQIDNFPDPLGGMGTAIGTCAGCDFGDLFLQIFEEIAGPTGVFTFTQTDNGVTLTTTVTVT